MVNNQDWYDFMYKANLTLKEGQPIDTFQSHIQAIFEPSFDDHLFLQLNWQGPTVKWYRTTWLKSVDSFKFDPIENLKYLGQYIQPTLKYERGEVNISKVIDIIDLVRKISIKPRIDKFGSITLDGCHYTLIFGVESFQTVYKWHSISDEWQELQTIADTLYNLDFHI